MSRPMRTLAGGFTIALIWLTVVPALAQERLFLIQHAFGAPSLLAELDTSDATLGTVLRTTHLPAGTQAIPVAGGRYLILYWGPGPLVSSKTLAVFDTRTFTGSIVPQWTLPGPILLAPDEYRPRVFYRTMTEVGVIEGPSFVPTALRTTGVDSPGCYEFASCWLLKYAAATNTLVLTRKFRSLASQDEVLSIDAETGAVRSSVTLDAQSPAALLVNNGGRTLSVPMHTGLYEDTEIHTYDLDTLAFLSRTTSYRSYPHPLRLWDFDVTRQRILGWTAWGPSGQTCANTPWVFALNANLALTASVELSDLDFSIGPDSMDVMASTVRNRTFVFMSQQRYTGETCPTTPTPNKVFLVSLNAVNLQPLAKVDLGKLLNAGPGDRYAILLSPPPPPSPLAHTINGRQVELTWRDPGDSTHFVVEVGTVPGRSNLGIVHVGNATQWTVDNVPSGQYYARVRALNDVGMSLTSNEVVVVVP